MTLKVVSKERKVSLWEPWRGNLNMSALDYTWFVFFQTPTMVQPEIDPVPGIEPELNPYSERRLAKTCQLNYCSD